MEKMDTEMQAVLITSQARAMAETLPRIVASYRELKACLEAGKLDRPQDAAVKEEVEKLDMAAELFKLGFCLVRAERALISDILDELDPLDPATAGAVAVTRDAIDEYIKRLQVDADSYGIELTA